MAIVVNRIDFSENVFKLVIEAPAIAKARKAGHFVIVRVDEKGERIPLTIAGADIAKGTIDLVIQKVGVSSQKIAGLQKGDILRDIVGPLGKATEIVKKGTILAAGGGVGVAPLLPIVKAFKEAGNRVLSVIAARTSDLVILEDEIRKYSDDVIVVTDDGSKGLKGVVTLGMEMLIQKENIDEAVIIGPPMMMKFSALLTHKYNIPTIASLNAIMVDGTGMCGACRVSVGGHTQFTCVDGPEFDAHQIDFDELIMRLSAFKDEEEKAKGLFTRQ